MPSPLIFREDLERALSLWDINENFKSLGEVIEIIQEGSEEPIVNIHADSIFATGGEWVPVVWITPADYVLEGSILVYYTDITQRNVIAVLDASALYYTYLPPIEDCISEEGLHFAITTKGLVGNHLVRPNPADSGAKLMTNSTGVAELLLTSGNQRKWVTDGTNWHIIGF